VTTKRSLGISPFQLVYGTEVVFPSQLALPVAKFFQDYQGEPDNMTRRIHQLVEAQQTREQVMDRAHDLSAKDQASLRQEEQKRRFPAGRSSA
jgi:hypothetical protein